MPLLIPAIAVSTKVSLRYRADIGTTIHSSLIQMLKEISCKLSGREPDDRLECFEESQRWGEVGSFDLFGFGLSMIQRKASPDRTGEASILTERNRKAN